MQSFFSLTDSFLFVPFCTLCVSLSLSLSNTQTHICWMYACPNFVFVISFLLLTAHSDDDDTRIGGTKSYSKEGKMCAYTHVIERSNRQKALQISMCFARFLLFDSLLKAGRQIQRQERERKHSASQFAYSNRFNQIIPNRLDAWRVANIDRLHLDLIWFDSKEKWNLEIKYERLQAIPWWNVRDACCLYSPSL